MNCYHVAFVQPCKEFKEGDISYSNSLRKLWKKLQLSEPNSTEKRDVLPSFKFHKKFFQVFLPRTLSIIERSGKTFEKKDNRWFDFEDEHCNVSLDNLVKELDSFSWKDLNYSELLAKKLHEVADLLPDLNYILNSYWLTCGHTDCLGISDNIALYGALKRLQTWNNASITLVCVTDTCDLWESELLEQLDVSVVKPDENILVDNNRCIWQGSLESLQNEQISDDWRLSQTQVLFYNDIAVLREDELLVDNIKVICELPKIAIPLRKILPSQFLLYHKSFLKQVLEFQESLNSGALYEENEETLLLASVASSDKMYERRTKKTADWMDFINTESDLYKEKSPARKTYYLVLYPIQPGIFTAYFIRAETLITADRLPDLFRTGCPVTEEDQDPFNDFMERKMLQLLDEAKSLENSPIKSDFSLAVHLDASEMLKHFTKDGKPTKKELSSLLKQMEEKGEISPRKQEEMQNVERKNDVQYCPDNTMTTIIPQPPPKHETLSICNNPQTLARAKLLDVKLRKSGSAPKQTRRASDRAKKTRSSDISLNEKQNEGHGTSKQDLPSKDQSKKRRRSFDGDEKAPAASGKEKRSDRHKRRLARVVKRCLVKYGVNPEEECFTTCSERLYYLVKSFLKDLKTSENLNNEMKKLADSNVATVVEFERRRFASRADVVTKQNTLSGDVTKRSMSSNVLNLQSTSSDDVTTPTSSQQIT